MAGRSNFPLEKNIFQPDFKKFSNFYKYIQNMESHFAAKDFGIAKVVPPPEWEARALGYLDISDIKIPNPAIQSITGSGGIYELTNTYGHPMWSLLTVGQFEAEAKSLKYCEPSSDLDVLERRFWNSLALTPRESQPVYASDVRGSLFDDTLSVWNINNLGGVLRQRLGPGEPLLDGIDNTFLFFGMWKTAFSWHTEDYDLYSISFLHYGSPKIWYTIAPSHAQRFEKVLESLYTEAYRTICPIYVRHKSIILNPSVLRDHGIPVQRFIQKPGEFIITFPRGYHSGWNSGYNCAEATNFATRRWIKFGRSAVLCKCSILNREPVRFDIAHFRQWIKV